MKITIKLSETNNALLNRVVKEEKVDASEFANNAFLDKFLPVSEKLGIEAGFILQEHEAGTLNAWLVKQSISRGIRWLGKHPIRDNAILKQILGRFPFDTKDNGKISTCNECVQSDMDSVGEFDADVNLLNCKNGTLDLKTMKFRSHNPDDKITKIADVVYDPNAKCPRFDQFLTEVMSGDADKSAFLQKALGYALSGDSRFECLFFLYGATTRNGKSTLMESVLRVFGDYGLTVAPETIAAKQRNSSGPSEDLARLAGRRLANISEPSRGMRLNAAQVKSMTGNDSINARFLHCNSFDFRPQFKLYINTNYLPSVDDMSLFSSNRVRVIPFDRHFEPQEQDPNLKHLFAKEESKSAILNWLIAGWQLLQKEGLNSPAAVVEATKEYSRDSNKIALFAEEKLIEDRTGEARTAAVYERYKEWCDVNGCLPENSTNFKKSLQAIGTIVRKRPRDGSEKTTLLLGYRLK